MDEVLRITVSGRVQGVGFRQFVASTAQRLGLAGWVRNLPTGEVEILARVTPAAKQRFLAALRQGPAMSRVEAVDVQAPPAAWRCPESGFAIRT